MPTLNQLARGTGNPYVPAGANSSRRWNAAGYGGPDNPYQFGRAGGLTWNSPAPSASLTDGSSGSGYIEGDPRYHKNVNGQWVPNETWLKSHIKNGQAYSQVRDPSRLIDPNAVEWDDEFGWMSNNKNFNSDEDWLDNMPGLVAALGIGGSALYHSLFAGAGAGAGATGGGATPFGTSGAEWATAGGGAGAGAGAGAAGTAAGAAGGGGLVSGLAGLAKPALGLAGSLFGGGGGAGGGGGGGNPLYDLLKLALAGGAGYVGNKQNKNFEADINRMIDIGTAGVTNQNRQGARDLVSGIYDGSISGDAVFDRVPGLRALSERGANDIARKWSAKGEAAANDPHQMKEWVDYNNELTTKAWNSEMDRASRIGGFDFNPAIPASMGMNAFSQLDYNQRVNNNDIFRQLGSFLNGGGSSATQGAGGIFDILSRLWGSGETNDNQDFTEVFPEDDPVHLPNNEDWFPSFWDMENY